jgi:hypothetical protein
MGGDIAGILAAGVAVWIISASTWRGAFLPLLVIILPAPLLLSRLSREPITNTAKIGNSCRPKTKQEKNVMRNRVRK